MRKSQPSQAAPIEFTRADPASLAQFDPTTKYCTMNCGPCSTDPRGRNEWLFLCDDCEIVAPALRPDQLDAIWRQAVAQSTTYASYQAAFASLAKRRS